MKQLMCRLCGQNTDTWLEDDTPVGKWTCPRCGVYHLTGSLYAELERGSKWQPILPLVRIATRNARQPLTLDTYNIQKYADGVFIPTLVEDRINLFLQIIHQEAVGLGGVVGFSKESDYPKFYCKSREEFAFLHHYCRDNALCSSGDRQIQLTVQGIERLERANRGVGSGKRVFVAMSFEEDDKPLFDDVFAKVCEDFGYEAYRVDRSHDLGKIDDAIQAGIRGSAFVIADFTKNKAGVYYEAGFAHALGKLVILTAHEREFKPDLKVHFDINHYPFITYPDFEKLRKLLAERIEARIGPYDPVR